MSDHIQSLPSEYKGADEGSHNDEDLLDNIDTQTGEVVSEDPGAKPLENNAEATKIHNSLKARKRTKTGCLSMTQSSMTHWNVLLLIWSSLSEKAYQVWRRTANLRKLHQIQTGM